MDIKSISKKTGLTELLLTAVVTEFGEGALQFLLDVHAHKTKQMLVAGDVIEGTDVTPPDPTPDPIPDPVDNSILEVIIQKYLPLIIHQYLPNLWKQYGPQIVQFVQNNLTTILNTFGPQIAQLIAQLFLNNLKKKQ